MDKYNSLVNNYNCFEPANMSSLPSDTKIIGSCFIFQTKRNQHGAIKQYKGWLVAQGSSQQEGIDYQEMFSPVAKFTSIQTLIAMAAEEGMHIHQANIDKAYLYGKLDDLLYMQVPQGVQLPGKVLRLNRSIYGLKQSGQIWNKTINASLLKLGYSPTKPDHCIYKKQHNGGMHYIALYVDNLLMIGPNLDEIE